MVKLEKKLNSLKYPAVIILKDFQHTSEEYEKISLNTILISDVDQQLANSKMKMSQLEQDHGNNPLEQRGEKVSEGTDFILNFASSLLEVKTSDSNELHQKRRV